MEDRERRSWVEIDLERIQANYKIYQKLLPADMKIMAVVKADAYGHGDTVIAETLANNGCRDFAVSNICEAIRLREAGIEGQILILGYTPPQCAKDLLAYDITQAVLSEEYADALKEEKVKVHFAIDTGMNRIGLDADDPEACERVIRKYAHILEITGLFTHLCVADTPEENEFTQEQILKFKRVVSAVEDMKLQYVHCMNSAGGLWQKPYGVFARLGIILYGLKPDYANVLPQGIKPALTWKSVISMIKTVHKGETIGYGRSFLAEKKMRIATIPTGYADGYSRELSNKGFVCVCGKLAPIVGRVCMDQLMIDVSDIPEASFGEEVSLLCDMYTADDMAHTIGTIGYEIVCDISKRVPRYYF